MISAPTEPALFRGKICIIYFKYRSKHRTEEQLMPPVGADIIRPQNIKINQKKLPYSDSF